MEPEKRQANSEPVSRRSFLKAGAAVIGGLAEPADRTSRTAPKPSSFLELVRAPDNVTAYTSFAGTLPAGRIALQPTGVQWRGGQVVVECAVQQDALVLTLAAPSNPIVRCMCAGDRKCRPRCEPLGDAWERSYGDLGWRDLIPERVMPWYFATYDGTPAMVTE